MKDFPEYRYAKVTSEIAEELRGIVGAANVVYNDPERLEAFAKDETAGGGKGRLPEAAVRPATAAEVSALLRLANRERIPVTPRGAGSGLSGGAVPVFGGIVLSLARMNRILEIDAENMMAVVEPGVVSNEINEAARKFGLFYAGYPMSVESCFIGGNVAENAGGGKAVKYGVTSRYVLGLEVVMPTGEIVSMGGKLLKDVTGYSMTQLMVGSEGTLGVFTKIILKLLPLPKFQVDLLCLFDSTEKAIAVVPKVIASTGIIPVSMEYMDRNSVKAACDYLNESLPYQSCGAMLIVSVDGSDAEQVEKEYVQLGRALTEAGASEIYVADNPTTSERVWRVRRSIAEAFNLISKRQTGEDLVAPPASMPSLVSTVYEVAGRRNAIVNCFGHAGDGNLHARISARPEWSDEEWASARHDILDELYGRLKEMGGVISGEHGIGHKRKDYMGKVVSEEYLNLIRSVKKTLDPNYILNPGKIFDPS